MVGKAVISTQTNCALFEFLRSAGVPVAFVGGVSESFADHERAFVAKRCSMVPLEWVSRRLAFGSFLKRNPNVKEGLKHKKGLSNSLNVFLGTRLSSVKLEHFFKDDANHDPFWSEESIISAELVIGGLLIEQKHVQQMLCITRLVFELLERVWQMQDHVLVDMKIEFGVYERNLLVADVIDNDSWRLWPKGEKSQMLDKQLYRDLTSVSDTALKSVKESFEIVAKRTQNLFAKVVQLKSHVAIVLGSNKDLVFVDKIKSALQDKYGVSDVTICVTSAHKSTQKTLEVVQSICGDVSFKAIIAVAGLSNGLGPVCAANCVLPVINCPPNGDSLQMDVWSSLRMPSGMGCSTVLGAENAALAAALIVANDNAWVWSRVRTEQTLTCVRLILS